MNTKSTCAIVLTLLSCVSIARAQEQMPEIESQMPGEIQIIRWSVLLNQTGADAVKKILQPIQTASKGYESYTCNGYELRTAITDANTNKGVEGFDGDTDYAQTAADSSLKMYPMRFFDLYRPDPTRAHLDGGTEKGEETFSRVPGDRMHIKLNDSQISAGMIEARRQKLFKDLGSIQYEGDLAPGDAVAFMVSVVGPSKTTYYHLYVWETFKAEPVLVDIVEQYRDAQWWCENGPAAARKLAAPAALWESQANHSAGAAPADFVKKLDDGKELSLIGLGEPWTTRFCWWDGHGQPIFDVPRRYVGLQPGRMNEVPPPNEIIALIQIKGPGSEYHLISPTTQPIVDNQDKERETYLEFAFVKVEAGATELSATVPVGPWQEAAQMNAGDTKEIDGVSYQIATPRANGEKNIALAIQLSAPLGDYLPCISAVNADGKEAVSMTMQWFPPILFESDLDPHAIQMQLDGMALKDVQYYRLCRRKLQTVTFKNFALQPLTPVKTDVTPDELAAAIKKLQDRAGGKN
jgi:hypothetical protein